MDRKEKEIDKELLDINRPIVQRIADEGLIEKIVNKVTKGLDGDAKDLEQDLCLSLMGDKKLAGIAQKGDLSFYLARIIMNNIASSSSPYFYKYKRFLSKTVPLDGLNI